MAERRNSEGGVRNRSASKRASNGFGRESPNSDDEQTPTKSLVMQRGVSQLLFHYLPGRTVDWENGLAIVMLTQPRLSSPVWLEDKAETVLNEISLLLKRWRSKGGSVDASFPDPVTQKSSFAIGTPEAIEAILIETAFICQHCSRLYFPKLNKLARSEANDLTCSDCGKQGLRQLGQVFVHGCGELVPIAEWMPATRIGEGGGLEPTSHPLRCRRCESEGKLALTIRTERVKDMKLECRKCETVVLERLTARCKKCLEELTARGLGDDAEPADHETEKKSDDEATGSVVARIAMRMARYNANATYYPQTLSMLRLDRPQITRSGDPDVELLRKMLPTMKRPTKETGAGTMVEEWGRRLKEAETKNDREEMARIRALILGTLGKDDE